MFKQGPERLQCLNCNESLQVCKLDNGDYAIGHLDRLTCGDIPKQTYCIVGSADEILDSFMSNPDLNREDNFELPGNRGF
jgi:hypothetical protein